MYTSQAFYIYLYVWNSTINSTICKNVKFILCSRLEIHLVIKKMFRNMYIGILYGFQFLSYRNGMCQGSLGIFSLEDQLCSCKGKTNQTRDPWVAKEQGLEKATWEREDIYHRVARRNDLSESFYASRFVLIFICKVFFRI